MRVITATEYRGWLMQIHACVKEKGGYFKHKFISDKVIFLLLTADYY